ncbi:POLX protein, partial [Pseudoatta argentina]
ADDYPIEKWLFEDIARITNLNELQRAIYGRKAINGTAAKFLRCHRIIDYVIRGINDGDINKMVLYGARTLEELKNKLRIYTKYVTAPQLIKNKTQIKKSNEVKSKTTKNTFEMKKERRFNCGRSGHKSDSYQNKKKGKNASIVILYCQASRRFPRHEKLINERDMIALIDTGSEINMMKYEKYNKRKIYRKELYTDASSKGYGAVLLQRDDTDGEFHPVQYMNRKMTDTEKKKHSLLNQMADDIIKRTHESDRGGAFMSQLFKEYCLRENISHYLITTGTPQRNGQVEMINRVILSILTKLSIEKSSLWYRHVRRVQQAIGRTPFEVMKLRRTKNPPLQQLLQQELLDCFINDRDNIRADARAQIEKIQVENVHQYNLRRKETRKYAVDKLVAIRRIQFTQGSKLLPNGALSCDKENRP